MKQFKSLDEQIDYLHNNKNIEFRDRGIAKNILLDGNYYNLISCGKVKFAIDIKEKSHVYEKHDFDEWCDYFKIDCEVSEYLMSNIIEFERVINSRTAFYVSELIENNQLKPAKKNEIIAQIKKAEVKNLPAYSGRETWKYITKMSFGETRYILNWLLENQKSVFYKIVLGYDFLRTGNIKQNFSNIVDLRNTIFHFTPLNIYLGFAKRNDGVFDNNYRKKAINFIFQLKPDTDKRVLLNGIMAHSDHFVKIKNSQSRSND